MSIYVFGNTKQTVEALDDKSLTTMIMEIAQAVCNAWAQKGANDNFIVWEDVPLRVKNWDHEWSQWGRQTIANYKFLAHLGLACCVEHRYRYHLTAFNAGYWNVLRWAVENTPNLPRYFNTDIPLDEDTDDHEGSMTQPPLIMPPECIHADTDSNDSLSIVLSYRNYYSFKIKQKYKDRLPKWTRRFRPKWLE